MPATLPRKRALRRVDVDTGDQTVARAEVVVYDGTVRLRDRRGETLATRDDLVSFEASRVDRRRAHVLTFEDGTSWTATGAGCGCGKRG